MFESYHSTRLHTGPPVPPFGHIAQDWVQLPETTPLQSRSGRVTEAQEEALPRSMLWNKSAGLDVTLELAEEMIATVIDKALPYPGSMVKVPGPTIVKVVATG